MKLWLLIFFKFVRRKVKLIGLILSILLIAFFTEYKFQFITNRTNNLTEGIIGTYQEHDIPDEVLRLLSGSLVKVDNDGVVKANLISGWQVNEDATVFTFILKEGLRWSDGTYVKSADLEFNIADTEILTPDEGTVQFKLKEPYSPFPSLLTKPVFKKGTKIGTGPYQLKSIEKSLLFITKLNLEPKNSDLPEISIRFYPNESVALTGFYMGEVQSVLGLTNIGQFSGEPLVNIKQIIDYSKIVTILYNTQDPILSVRSLRQALSYQAPKIDKEEEANSPYPKNFWVYNKDAKKYLSNNEQALQALERAEENLSKEKLAEPIILTSVPKLEEVAKKVESSWKQIGFDVKLRVESGIPQNFQILLITQSIPEDPDQYFLWHSTQKKTNLTGYSTQCCPQSARIDKDLEDGRKSTKEEERREKYLDFHKVLMEDSPATFLYFPKYNIVYLKKAKENLEKVLDLQITNW